VEKLHQLVTDLRSDLQQPDLPFIAGELGRWNPDYTGIRKEMEQIPEVIPNAHLVSTAGLTADDTHHFDRSSVRELGKRLAEKFLEVRK